jgi:hypothetical protein
MANKFSLDVDEDNIEEIPVVAPEELTDGGEVIGTGMGTHN